MASKRKASPSLTILDQDQEAAPRPAKLAKIAGTSLRFPVSKHRMKSTAIAQLDDHLTQVKPVRTEIAANISDRTSPVSTNTLADEDESTTRTSSAQPVALLSTEQDPQTAITDPSPFIRQALHVHAIDNSSGLESCEAIATCPSIDDDVLGAATSIYNAVAQSELDNTPQQSHIERGSPSNLAQPQAQQPEPRPSKSGLWDNLELAERHIPIYSSTKDVEYRNPWKFCVKPAYWRRWTAPDYVNLAEHFRTQFDAVPFARANGKPVEEVQHMFNSVVVDPLYNFATATKRGEGGMNKLFEFFSQSGTVSRPWMDGKVKGELEKVSKKGVRVILECGSVKEIPKNDLGKQDMKYLEDTLSKDDWSLMSDDKEGQTVEEYTGD